MERLSRFSGIVFGVSMLLLSFIICAEVLLRKFFAFSLGGVDELGGYAVAIVAPLAFVVAAADSAHIRINLLHTRLPVQMRALLNLLAIASLALLALFLLYFTVTTVQDTLNYRSIAQTPWATPLIYPQSVWLVAMALFAAATLIMFLRALKLAVERDWYTLDRKYGPGSPDEEVVAELEDLKKRQEISQ